MIWMEQNFKKLWYPSLCIDLSSAFVKFEGLCHEGTSGETLGEPEATGLIL